MHILCIISLKKHSKSYTPQLVQINTCITKPGSSATCMHSFSSIYRKLTTDKYAARKVN